MNDPIWPYSLTFEQREGYLYAFINAETLTRESALRYLGEISDKCIALNCRRLLIERDVLNVLSHADLFFICEEFAAMMQGIRIAFVNHQTSNKDGLSFALLVLGNRGVQAEIHPSIESAEMWLLK